ncbi:histidine triad nucleotide-binding protein [Saccharothrix violaceirubra]|uniref:Histidine triad (HIT) family protein n=1 Tax=Saccharothrix violaceirubra TaxID=413306 RepID=A0A7W7WY62_9PSEU|nr:histidine triad nucleotide-binding protein [Saccharothrix violaceirubra]MBB4967877.1 histidine triad (HIT) family protein [Saccharothrix violaceirubra]
MSDCLFCRIVARELPATVVHETDTTLAFRDIAPQAPVHVIVVPKIHATDAVALTTTAPGVLDDLFRTAGEVAKTENVADSGYRLLFNTGVEAGQTVFHAHLHVLGGRRLGPLA